MAHALTETPQRGVSISVPDPGDVRSASSVEAPFQKVANRLKYLELNALGAHGDVAEAPLEAAALDELVGAHWAMLAGTWLQTDVSVAAAMWLTLPVPPLCELTLVNVRLVGAITGSHSSLPATKPKATLYAINQGVLTSLATVTDPSASTAVYDAPHNISISGSFTISVPQRFLLKVEGETGANAIASKLVWAGATYSWGAAP